MDHSDLCIAANAMETESWYIAYHVSVFVLRGAVASAADVPSRAGYRGGRPVLLL